MHVRFWGTRGSIAVSGIRFTRTGGCTSCVEVEHDGARLILDGGTGLRALGEDLGCAPIDATVLFSHVHWDHIQGVPFFLPAYHPAARLTFAGATRDRCDVRDALSAQMRAPSFPVTLDVLRAELRFRTVTSGQPFEVGPFRITPLDVDHPGGTLAYRVEAGGRILVYATDVELAGTLPVGFVDLCEGADLLLHDAQYTAAEYPTRRGWGHSTWEDAIAVGRAAGVRRLGLFHHDPARDDDAVAVIEARARETWAPTFAARDGTRMSL